MSKKLDLRSPGAIEINSAMFHDVQVAIIYIYGVAYMMGIDVGRALGYERPGDVQKHYKQLADRDRYGIKGELLRIVKSRAAESAAREIRANVNYLMLITQAGAEALAMLAKTERGLEFRSWISNVVLPAHRERVANQASEQPRRPPRVLPPKAPSIAEQREARLKLKEQNSEWKVITSHQKAMTAAEREHRMSRRDERDAEDKATKLALSAKRVENEARRVENDAKRIEIESKLLEIEATRVQAEAGRTEADVRCAEIEATKLMITMCDQLDGQDSVDPEVVAGMRTTAFEKLAGDLIPASVLDGSSGPVWDSDSDLALRFDMSAQDVGVIIEELGIKDNPDMFRIRLVKAPHSNKTVEMYEYSPAAVELMEATIREWMAASSSR